MSRAKVNWRRLNMAMEGVRRLQARDLLNSMSPSLSQSVKAAPQHTNARYDCACSGVGEIPGYHTLLPHLLRQVNEDGRVSYANPATRRRLCSLSGTGRAQRCRLAPWLQ